jgi:hypothetical protein
MRHRSITASPLAPRSITGSTPAHPALDRLELGINASSKPSRKQRRSGAQRPLSEGADFAATEANAIDGAGAFQLPNPDPDNDGVTSYSVYARGTPTGPVDGDDCATDPTTNARVASRRVAREVFAP